MKIDEVIFRRLLHEVEWGDVAFGPERVDIESDEENVEEEDIVLGQIIDYVRLKSDIEDTDAIRSAMIDPRYSDVLSQPDAEEIYRGMSVPLSMLSKWLRIKQEEIPRTGLKNLVGVKVRPRNMNVTSWTTKSLVAHSFAIGDPLNRVSVVYSASVSDNPGVLLDIKNFLERVNTPAHTLAREYEVLALGPVLVKTIEWGY